MAASYVEADGALRIGGIGAALLLLGVGPQCAELLPASSGMLEGLDAERVALGLSIFAAVAVLWLTEALPLSLTALLVPLVAALLRARPLAESLVAFADPLIFLFLGGFALATALSRHGIDRWFARRILRCAGERFFPSAWLIFAATAFVSMWISNTATTAMILPLCIGLLGTLGRERRHVSSEVFLLLGVAYAASIGGLGTIVGSPPNGIVARQLGIGFGEWMSFGVVVVAVLLPLMVGVLHVVIPLGLAASCAFMLPVATPPNVLVHATGMVPQRLMMKAGLVLNVVCAVALTLVACWLLR